MVDITDKELESMMTFFRKKYFDGIPNIMCYFAPQEFFDDETTEACFGLEQNENYSITEDELYDSYGYSHHYEIEEGFGFDYGTPSWTDPLNKPTPYIAIVESLRNNDPRHLIGTLLHELAHYWCWYCGYDHSDGSEQYERKLKEMGIPSNFERRFNKDTKQWEDAFDYEKMEDYYFDYLSSLE
ncbi:MAG: hypothetical protein IKP66_07960 [Lachnospiraceae bacterium]|jgi:hypothetical protein|nr:hypothetical protein [Lachnospiraceae bacterium]